MNGDRSAEGGENDRVRSEAEFLWLIVKVGMGVCCDRLSEIVVIVQEFEDADHFCKVEVGIVVPAMFGVMAIDVRDVVACPQLNANGSGEFKVIA